MARKKTVHLDTQPFPLDNGVLVTVTFEKGKRPKMVYLDGVVIVGDHACSGAPASAVQQAASEPERGPSLDEIRDFQRRRDAQPPRKPLTSADVAREQGFNPEALDFENISRIADSMALPEDGVVE